MDIKQRTASHIFRLNHAVTLIGGNVRAAMTDAIASALVQVVAELAKALTDLATEVHAISGRLDALEHKN